MPTTPESRACQNCKQSFTIEPDDFGFYEKIKVPPPTLCWECRLQRRMVLRNERTLYNDQCDLCHANMVSMYSPDKKVTTYCRTCWYSDNWDPMEYGTPYDWNRSIFEQFHDLVNRVPRINLFAIKNNANADYANFIVSSKNIYLAFSIVDCEDIYASRQIDKSKNVFDSFNVQESDSCYENVDCYRNYRVYFSVQARECINSSFLFDCVNCQDCFMSSNIRNGKYIFRNQQYTKESYRNALISEKLSHIENIRRFLEEFDALQRTAIHRFANLYKTVGTTGHNVENAKNSRVCFDIYNIENMKYCVRMVSGKDSYNIIGGSSELLYEGVAGGFGTNNTKFFTYLDAVDDSLFVDWCQNSNNLLCCAGLRKKEHCILNRHYAKQEYEIQKQKILEHAVVAPYRDARGRISRFGEFFPIEFSPWAYNETVAQEYFPLTKQSAADHGYSWRDPDPYPYVPTKRSVELPPDISDVDDGIFQEIIACGLCDKAYRIAHMELAFLRQNKLPLPEACLECRHKRRFAMRNPYKLWHRKCMNTGCQNEFETSYAPDRKEIVYCESCYQKEVI